MLVIFNILLAILCFLDSSWFQIIQGLCLLYSTLTTSRISSFLLLFNSNHSVQNPRSKSRSISNFLANTLGWFPLISFTHIRQSSLIQIPYIIFFAPKLPKISLILCFSFVLCFSLLKSVFYMYFFLPTSPHNFSRVGIGRGTTYFQLELRFEFPPTFILPRSTLLYCPLNVSIWHYLIDLSNWQVNVKCDVSCRENSMCYDLMRLI